MAANQLAPGEIRLGFYAPAMRKQPGEYFGGRCPIAHPLNAKAMWGDRAAFAALNQTFEACLGRLVAEAEGSGKGAQCGCFDEETVLAHLLVRQFPCDRLPHRYPRFEHLQVYRP